MRFDVTVEVHLRPGIADPEGSTVERALPTLGFDGVSHVRVGKLITFELEADSAEQADQQATDMCQRFLTNPVIEDARVAVAEAQPA
ncbi:MAG: phosphoribosylformylglycinamidine synthase subunit PurS [Acidimicrobiales bacterium]